MRQILSLIFLFAVVCCFSCKNSKDKEEKLTIVNAVELRIKNDSSFDYDELRVDTGGGQHVYGDIAAGEITEYIVFDYAYSYAFVELKIDGEVFTIQPFDYIGETKLDIGKYTYEIKAEASGTQYDRLSLNFVID